MFLNSPVVEEIIRLALQEDIGTGDVTTNAVITPGDSTAGFFRAREAGVVAGLEVAKAVYKCVDENVSFVLNVEDGNRVVPGDILARVEGKARSLLTGERVALNFLQRMSGIASHTHRLTEIIKGCKAKITDTRKTTPGLRILEKYAVRVGGGVNHRFGLYDAVMIKDNHIAVAGSILEAVKRVRNVIPHTMKIEVEVEDLAGLDEALISGADIIMLDNMNLQEISHAVKIVAGRALLEASGGIGEDNVLAVARTGVDYISVGSLTHSVKSIDIGLDIGEAKCEAGK